MEQYGVPQPLFYRQLPLLARKPGVMQLLVALSDLVLLFFLWRQSRQQSREERIRAELMAAAGRGERMGRQADKAARRAARTMSEYDWQQALMDLKERWNPSRLELEKVSISRH